VLYVLVWGWTESGRKQNFVGLRMYIEWKEIELCWFEDVHRVEGNRILKRVLHMYLGSTRPRGRL
jgi:hypothetical protein